jgi:uncharacterized membrane protein
LLHEISAYARAKRRVALAYDLLLLIRMAILALAFESPPLAHHALHEARRLHEQHQLALHDVVVVSAEDGPAKVVESMDPTPLAAAVPSTLLGAIVGVLVAGPLGFLIGGAVAGSTGALVTKLVDTGIPHRLIAKLCKRAKPGQAVVAMLVDDGDVDSLRKLPGAQVVYEN